MIIGEPIPTPELVRGWAKMADKRGAVLEAIRYRDVAGELERLRKAAKYACDLLSERTQGSPARSPGHNARLALEAALETE